MTTCQKALFLGLACLLMGASLDHSRAQSEADGKLLLRDFKPRTRLDVKSTPVDRAAAPVIDIHFHMNPEADPEAVIGIMDDLNIQTIVNLGLREMHGENLRSYVQKWVTPYPSRFAVLANLDATTVNDPDFSQKAVARLREDVRNGAIGLKIFKDLGLVWKDPQGQLIPADDPRFDPIWATCAELGVPVLIHLNDPRAFFDPVDQFNERYLSLAVEGRSSWSGRVEVTHQDLMQQFENIIQRHPQTTFVAAHLGLHYEHLHTGARWLETYPNLYFGLGASFKHLGRQPYTARRFLMRFQDRILFGCDIGRVPRPEVYRYMFRMLETDDEYFEHVEPEAGIPWRMYGLYLPESALRKIYFSNARKVFNLHGEPEPKSAGTQAENPGSR